MDFQILQVIRVIAVSVVSFLIALSITPFVMRLLSRYGFKKQIRTTESAPIYSQLHSKKEGTPTGGGIIIWGAVLITAIIFWVLDYFFGNGVVGLDFIDRNRRIVAVSGVFFLGLCVLISQYYEEWSLKKSMQNSSTSSTEASIRCA